MKDLLVLVLCLTVAGITPVVAQEVAEPEEETGNPFQKDEVDKRIDKAIDSAAKSLETGNLVHSSKTMVMVEPKSCCI